MSQLSVLLVEDNPADARLVREILGSDSGFDIAHAETLTGNEDRDLPFAVLEMRASCHDKDIRDFTIDGEGMHIGRPFRNVEGILPGHPPEYRRERSRAH